MPKPAELENTIKIGFCDDSTSERTFETTAWGNLQVKADFIDLMKQAQRNETVFGKFPHIVELHLFMPSDPNEEMCEQYACPCAVKKVSHAG